MSDLEISKRQPLVQSVRFKLNDKWTVQIGNPGIGYVCLMPAETTEDFALIEHLKKCWHDAMTGYTPPA